MCQFEFTFELLTVVSEVCHLLFCMSQFILCRLEFCFHILQLANPTSNISVMLQQCVYICVCVCVCVCVCEGGGQLEVADAPTFMAWIFEKVHPLRPIKACLHKAVFIKDTFECPPQMTQSSKLLLC